MANKSGAVKRSETATPAAGKTHAKPAAVPKAAHPNEDAGLDRLIYERVRLGIMSALAMNEQLTFNELKSLFDVSDGNLSAHARKLEEAGYVVCTKSFEARRPKSQYRITPVGKKALLRYLQHIEAVIKATRRA
jgi:DNA-binding MarR family transcriptional regulator